jgi:3-methyladenine DNA glycosylase/8-oxoguanine DNA glycosylase
MSTLLGCRNGALDPTTRVSDRSITRVTLTPGGPVVVAATENPDGSVSMVDPVSGEECKALFHPLFGDDDPGHDVQPRHPAVTSAMDTYGDYRVPHTGTPYHDLLPAVLGQRVTAAEALSQWAQLCRRFGEPVAAGGQSMHAPPEPGVLLSVPYHEFHQMGIDRRRAETLRNVARHGDRLIGGWRQDLTPHERTMSLTLIDGVGVWTASVAGYTAFCDPDALEIGDFHVKNTVSYALTGNHRGSDEEMCRLLEPYAGQRQRVVKWLGMAGWRAPAHGPRRRIVRIARL